MAENDLNSYILDEELKMKIIFISIEGNIGSGKSTLISMLKKYNDAIFKKVVSTEIHFVDEPVKEWETIRDGNDENSKNILECFYENQEKYSFTFQITAYITRVKKIKECIDKLKNDRFIELNTNDNMLLRHFRGIKKYFIITERCLNTDRFVFAKMLYDSSKINELEWNSYNQWFDFFANEFIVDNIVYVATDPNICSQRIKNRLRDGEAGISIDYLTECDRYHREWISSLNQNILVFNAHDEIDVSKKINFKYITPIINLIKELMD